MRSIALAILVALALACGGSLALPGTAPGASTSGSSTWAASAPEVAVCAPWASMGLPIQEGKVSSCSDRTIVVLYGAAQPADLDRRYSTWAGAAGWPALYDTSNQGMYTAVFQGPGKKIGFSAMMVAGECTVALSLQ